LLIFTGKSQIDSGQVMARVDQIPLKGRYVRRDEPDVFNKLGGWSLSLYQKLHAKSIMIIRFGLLF
jgi:hypothetical protein